MFVRSVLAGHSAATHCFACDRTHVSKWPAKCQQHGCEDLHWLIVLLLMEPGEGVGRLAEGANPAALISPEVFVGIVSNLSINPDKLCR